jgi:SCP-2 sterol transfer family
VPPGRVTRSSSSAASRWCDRDLDPHLLLWDMHRNLDTGAMPPGRTVLKFSFPDRPATSRHWWIVVNPDEVDFCDVDPGFDVRVTVESPLRAMVRIWRGDLTWQQALRSGEVTVHGDAQSRRAVTSWLKLSPLAQVPRPEPAPGAR